MYNAPNYFKLSEDQRLETRSSTYDGLKLTTIQFTPLLFKLL